MTFDVIMGILRHLLTLGGGLAIEHGWATSDDTSAIGGGIVAVLSVLWSIWQKKHTKP